MRNGNTQERLVRFAATICCGGVVQRADREKIVAENREVHTHTQW